LVRFGDQAIRHGGQIPAGRAVVELLRIVTGQWGEESIEDLAGAVLV
jgi:hypothetical protein